MRSLELGKAAIDAEKIYLIAFVKRQLLRGGYGAVALIFLAGIVVWASVVAFLAIALAIGPLWAAAILLLINVILFGLLALLALRSRPGPVEIEAAQVRDEALAAAKREIAISTLVLPIGRLVGRSALRMTGAAIMAPFRSSSSPRK